MKRGILYILLTANDNKGLDYRNIRYDLNAELLNSVTSIRRCDPRMKVALITDIPDYKCDMIDNIIYVERNPHIHPCKLKIKYMIESPFNRTFFMDLDTQLIKPIAPVFSFLKKFDLAMPVFEKRDGKGLHYQSSVVLYNQKVKETIFTDWYNKNPDNAPNEGTLNKIIRNIAKGKVEYDIKIKKLDPAIYNNGESRGGKISKLDTASMHKNAVLVHRHYLHRSRIKKKLKLP